MTETLNLIKETNFIDLSTGEVYESHTEACKAYNEGVEIQVIYRNCYNGTWGKWQNGPKWYH